MLEAADVALAELAANDATSYFKLPAILRSSLEMGLDDDEGPNISTIRLRIHTRERRKPRQL